MEDTRVSLDNFPRHLNESLNKIALDEKFVTYNVVVNKIVTPGGSHTGGYYEVDIAGKTEDGNKELNLFVKKIVPEIAENLKEWGSIDEGYERETFVYTELSDIFIELQNKYNVPQAEKLKIIKGYKGSNGEVLILENVAKRGFKTDFRMDLITYDSAKLTLEELAKFHGFSFIVKKLKPTFYHEKIRPIKSFINWTTFRNRLLSMMTTNAGNLNDDKTREKLLKFIPKAIDKMQAYYEDDSRSRVLCHGDFRMNNTLIKRTDDAVTEVIPMDFQTIFFGNPVTDILYFIYSGTDREFREAHLSDLLDVYYNTMERFLGYFDIDLKDDFPKEVFLKDFDECRDFGLTIAMMLIGILLAKEEDVMDFSKEKIEVWQPKVHESFQDRFGDIINEFL